MTSRAPVSRRSPAGPVGAAPLLVALAAILAPRLVLADCAPGPFAVQVLGSAGVAPADGRASSGYLVWVDGEARVLVDAGGGAWLRFRQSRADTEHLDVVGLTRLRVDHTADLPAVLEAARRGGRTRPLTVAGPRGDRAYPGTGAFLKGLFHRRRGVYRYLSGLLDGRDGALRLTVTEVGRREPEPVPIHEAETFRVDAFPVHHGGDGAGTPGAAFQVRTPRFRVVFGADPRERSPAYLAWIAGVDLLVVPLPAPPTSVRDEVLALAAAVRARHLALSHRGDRDRDLREAVYAVFEGELLWADDLECFEFQHELPPPEPAVPPAALPGGPEGGGASDREPVGDGPEGD